MLNYLWTGINVVLIANGSFTGTGIVHMTNGVFDSAAYLGSPDQVLCTNNAGTDTTWATVAGDVAPTTTPATWHVTGLQGRPVASTAPSDGNALVWSAGAGQWQPGSGGSTVTWASDLAGSTSSNQYVQSISGNGGAGGVVDMGATVVLTGLAGAGGLSIGSWTGNTTLTTGALSWAGASGKAASIVATAAAITITAAAASTWSTTSGALTLTSAAAATWSTGAGVLTINGSGGLHGQTGGVTVISCAAASSDFVALGASPAASGYFRVPSAASTIISCGIELLGTDGSNNLVLNGSTEIFLEISGTNALTLVSGTATFNTSTVTWQQGNTPTLTQAQQASASNPNNFTIAPQAPGASASTSSTGTPGSLVVNVAAPVGGGGPSEAGLVVERGGSFVSRIGMVPGNSTYGFLHLGVGITASSSNFSIASDGNQNMFFNGPGSGSTIGFAVAGTPVPAGVTTGGFSGNAGQNLAMAFAACAAITTPTTGTITPTAAQYACPVIPLSMTLTGSVTVALPNAPGFFIFDLAAVVFNSNTLKFSSGSGSTATISAFANSTNLVMIVTNPRGTNTISMLYN